MKTKFYLDTRSKAKDLVVIREVLFPTFPVKIAINHKGSSAYLPTGVFVAEPNWMSKPSPGQVVGCHSKDRLNIVLAEKKLEVDKILEALRVKGELHGLTASEMREKVIKELDRKAGSIDGEATLIYCFDKFINKCKKSGTKRVYISTKRKLLSYPAFSEHTTFRDITPSWLSEFNAWMTATMPSANARAIHFRNIRAVYNDACADGLTSAPYAFKRYKIEYQPTADLSLTPEELRALRDAPCHPAHEKYRDLFFLSFYLCGMNLEDILAVQSLKGNRIEKLRIKTGQPLSVNIEPEARAIIDKYKGTAHLLSLGEGINHTNFLRRMDKYLKRIGTTYNPKTKEWEGDAVIPGLSFYWARYSWATIAAELDFPERTIGSAMGHGTAKMVTSIYMRVDMRNKIDEVNRAVIDYFLTKD